VKLLRAALLIALLPLVTGMLVVTYQDASLTHWPGKATTRDQLRAGTFPFLHPGASFGQPLAGNPNFGVFFPDTLLLFVLPLPVAFGLRFALPFLLAFVGARRWARAEGVSRAGAEAAAVAFALSPVFVSTWRFYNSGLAVAVAPWVVAAVVKIVRADEPARRRRALAEAGFWGGLELLAGEPVVALLTAVAAGLRVLVALREKRSASFLPAVAASSLLALLLAAPQIAATAQILPDSSRVRAPFPFVTATGTSTHPVRLVEQLLPYPYGRPDLRGRLGFDGHEVFDHHQPYLWTLHLGLGVLALLVLHSRPRAREEWPFLLATLAAALLAFGRYLAAARELSPLLSLGGRVRFPVKWWYFVLLALVPLVARAAARFAEGDKPTAARRGLAAVLGLAALIALASRWPATLLAAASPLVALAVLFPLLLVGTAPRVRTLLPAALAACLFVSDLPLFLTFLDRPPADPPRAATGRILARLDLRPHPEGPATHPDGTTRAFYRRASEELWPLVATVTGGGYAFDDDPDGAYADEDRALRKLLEDRSWPERAAELRLAGVTHVLADEPVPYREVAVLNDAEGVRLYAVDGAMPSVRFATRVHRRETLPETVALHARPGYDPSAEVVLPGTGKTTGTINSARVETIRETPDQLTVRLDARGTGILVWSRTFFSAWRARVDGAAVAPVRADGHLTGVPVPAGAHTVEISWSPGPVLAGGVLALLGLAAVVLLRR
jgi:hypothetical protein